MVAEVSAQTSSVPAQPREIRRSAASPFIYVTRFCGEEEASASAAIRQAIDVLDSFLKTLKAHKPEQLIVRYRNRLPGAVTLDIGYPVDQAIADRAGGEILRDTSPSGLMSALSTGPGFAALLAADQQLAERGTPHADNSHTQTWQFFEEDEFRPWLGHPASLLMMATPEATASNNGGLQ